MVASLFHPLNIFILGLGGGFIIPLLSRLGKVWVSVVFVLALTGMTLISGVSLFKFMAGALPIEILTGGCDAAIFNQFARRSCGKPFQRRDQSGRLARCRLFCTREVLGDADLPDHGDGHPGHGDDSRSFQSVRVSRDRLSCHVRAAQLAEYASGALGNVQVSHGHRDSLDVFPARHGAALCRDRHVEYR